MSTMNDTVVLSAVRTPIGKLGGALSSLRATTLGAEAVRVAAEKSGVAPEALDHVIMGEVIQAGTGQAPARQTIFFAGLPKTIVADTVNKVCASGMLAIANGHRLIQTGDARTVVAGGMESMSGAPYLVPYARFGYKMGNAQLLDAMVHDGLWEAYFHCMMADATDGVATYFGVTRAQQDEFALRSHKRAIEAHEQGRFADEMIPLKVATKQRGRLIVDAVPVARSPVGVGVMRIDETPQQFVADPKVFSPYLADPSAPFTLVDRDEAPRKDSSLEVLAKLKPIVKNGNITAGN